VLKFSNMPGMHERQLIRKYENPLFEDNVISEDDLSRARYKDKVEIEDFMNDFQNLVQEAVDFDVTSDPEVVLKLKEQLDKSYEKCAGLAGDQGEIKEMLVRLISAIMKAMWKGVGNDYTARSKLEMEEKARSEHFSLLEHKIVVDMIRPDSIIKEDELVASLLSESEESFNVALQLFHPEQQAALCKLAGEKLGMLEDGHPLRPEYMNKLIQMEMQLKAENSMPL